MERDFTVAAMAFAKSKYHSAGTEERQYLIPPRVLTHSGDRRFLRNKDDDDHGENDGVPHWGVTVSVEGSGCG